VISTSVYGIYFRLDGYIPACYSLIMNNTELIKRIVALFPIASKDVIRVALSCVDLSAAPGRRELILRVTDGHRLITERIEHETLPELIGDKHLMFLKEDIALLKMMKGDVEVIKRADSLVFNGGSIVRAVLFSTTDYPNTEVIKPKYEDDISISFNPRYLYELMKALKCDDSKTEMVTITFSKSNSRAPIKVKGCVKAECLLMPMRGEK